MSLAESGRLFSHVTSEKAALYRAILDSVAAAKRAFRLHLRPDDLLREAQWPGPAPSSEELAQALDQLVAWGNLRSQADTARVSTLEDFYRRRLLYRLTADGEAVEAGLAAFAEALARKGELQTVALDDILARLNTLQLLAADAGPDAEPDAQKVHEALRDLVHVFEGLARHAEAADGDDLQLHGPGSAFRITRVIKRYGYRLQPEKHMEAGGSAVSCLRSRTPLLS